MGKAILVISHDDLYFHLADRLLRMENGRLTLDRQQPVQAEPQATMPLLAAANSIT